MNSVLPDFEHDVASVFAGIAENFDASAFIPQGSLSTSLTPLETLQLVAHAGNVNGGMSYERHKAAHLRNTMAQVAIIGSGLVAERAKPNVFARVATSITQLLHA